GWGRKGGPAVMGRLRRKSFRRYAAVALAVGVTAAMVVLLPGGAGAARPTVSTAVSSHAVSARALGAPKLIRPGALVHVKSGSAGASQSMPRLSPLGQRALARAQANAAANAPRGPVTVPGTPAGGSQVRTPGGAITGF